MLDSSAVRGKSPVTLPGYRAGMKPANAGKTYPAEVPSREDVHQLLAAFGSGPSGDRYRAAVVLMYRCGLRVSEALALRPCDVDLRAGTVTVLRGKGNRRRVVGIDPQAGALVAVWLERRAKLGAAPSQPIVCLVSKGKIGNTVYSSVLREAIKDAAVRAGITKRMHPHGFRHAFASENAREGMPLPFIQRLLGHKSLETTARYLVTLTPWEAIERVKLRSWLEEAPELELVA